MAAYRSLFIYSPHIGSRLQYICEFVFGEQLGVKYSLSDDEELLNSTAPVINYSKIKSNCLQLSPNGLLQENNIHEINPEVFNWDGAKAFFASQDDLGFDILSAVFYLISRYEEYLPYTPDKFGRFPHTASLAYKHGFLKMPLVNIWLKKFAEKLLAKYPLLQINFPSPAFVPTYDIDLAFAMHHRGWMRNITGWLSAVAAEGKLSSPSLAHDIYDVYAQLHKAHEEFQINPIYFFLVAAQRSEKDQNISPDRVAIQQLIKEHASKYQVGVHPSWQSFDKVDTIIAERKKIEEIIGASVTSSRQHFLRMQLPKTYETLIDAGIQHDYTMGYGEINGFRASVASSFFWYNLKEEKTTTLRVHPFCFMDANSRFQLMQTPEEAFIELMDLYIICRQNNGTCITIFNNNILGTHPMFRGWMEMYLRFLAIVDRV